MNLQFAEKSVKIDFFSFTTRRPVVEVLPLFSSLPQPLVPRDKGLYGYNLSYASPSGVTVLFSADRDDVHVQLSGEGCDKFGFVSLLGLMSPGDTCTRLDIAVDCMSSGFTCADIWGLLQAGQYISVSSNIRKFEGLLSKPCGRKDYTVYIGSPTSERMVRIYDKGAEQETGNDWLRYEVQLRGASADRFLLLISAGTEDSFKKKSLSLLSKQIRFITEDSVSLKEQRHHDRVKLHPFWTWLVDSSTGFNLQVPKKVKKACNIMRYVKHSGAALKTLKGAMPDFDEWIHDVVAEAKLKPHHKQIQDEMLMPDQREVSYMEVFPMNLQECF